MKALTIWQPWAGLIMVGAKRVENRAWKPKLHIGEWFAIHAGKAVGVEEWIEPIICEHAKRGVWESGYIYGAVKFMGVVTSAAELPEDQRKWFVGPLAWILGEPEVWRSPIQIKGKLGLWNVRARAKEVIRLDATD